MYFIVYTLNNLNMYCYTIATTVFDNQQKLQKIKPAIFLKIWPVRSNFKLTIFTKKILRISTQYSTLGLELTISNYNSPLLTIRPWVLSKFFFRECEANLTRVLWSIETKSPEVINRFLYLNNAFQSECFILS